MSSAARNATPIYDITPFTALDYPDHLAAIIWFAGCNMRCDYCYNRAIVFGEGKQSIEEALHFLQKRQGLLEGVVLSGGEATLFPEIVSFCKAIKALGYKIKLDTNGLQTETVKELVANALVDYIALDFKAPREKFADVTKNRHYDQFEQTLDFLIASGLPFEARTTVHIDLIDENDINAIIGTLVEKGYQGTYYIQEFIYDEQTIGEMPRASRRLDRSKIRGDLPVEFRN